MRIAVIGATGHVGGYLVPRLVRAGHQVIALSRGSRSPYHRDEAWSDVRTVVVDRATEDAAGTFAGRIRDLAPDVVVDMICFSRPSAHHLVDGLVGDVGLLVHCGSIWVHGVPVEVPTTEDAERRPFGTYGTAKAAIEELLTGTSRDHRLPAVVLHPGHISGPGWAPINPAGNLDPDVWRRLATGEPVVLPNLGLETLHHVHADDVAQAFELAVAAGDTVGGQSFHVVSERAVTMRGYAETVASWFGHEAHLEYLPFDAYRRTTTTEHADLTWQHVSRSPVASIDKARTMLGYAPRHTSMQTVAEALAWQQEHASAWDLPPLRSLPAGA